MELKIEACYRKRPAINAYPKKDSFEAEVSELATFTEKRKLGHNITIEAITQ